MTLIDHRILVAAPPQVIWELVGDLSATPKWHVNCSQASVLNTRQSGPGTRCRLSITNGPDIVFEIDSTKDLTDELAEKLRKAVAEFKTEFMARRQR